LRKRRFAQHLRAHYIRADVIGHLDRNGNASQEEPPANEVPDQPAANSRVPF